MASLSSLVTLHTPSFIYTLHVNLLFVALAKCLGEYLYEENKLTALDTQCTSGLMRASRCTTSQQHVWQKRRDHTLTQKPEGPSGLSDWLVLSCRSGTPEQHLVSLECGVPGGRGPSSRRSLHLNIATSSSASNSGMLRGQISSKTLHSPCCLLDKLWLPN